MQNNIESLESLKTLVMRALSGDKNAEFYFKKSRLPNLVDSKLSFPTIDEEEISIAKYSYIRGVVDSVSLQLKYHDRDILNRVTDGKDFYIRDILNNAEKARCELLGINNFKGIEQNISNKIENDFQSENYESYEDNQALSKAFYLSLISANSDIKFSAKIEKFADKISGNLKSKDSLDLKGVLSDQEKFLDSVIQIIGNLEDSNHNSRNSEESEDNDDDDIVENNDHDVSKHNENEVNQENSEDKEDKSSEDDEQSSALFSEGQDLDLKKSTGTGNKIDVIARNFQEEFQDQVKYKVFTKKYDQITDAAKLTTREDLDYLNQQFEIKLSKLKKADNKDTNKFIRTLISVANKKWKHNLEDGSIDTKKLPLIIANPNYKEYYKKAHASDNNNTVVTLLLDNSGSMRGKPISVAAMSCEIIAKILERFSIKTEILGFTTCQWKGGKSRKEWQDQGSANNPGRLNDLRHIIYKSADTPYIKAKRNIALMLKEGILKENIDGEAILWAMNRLNNRSEKRKIIMVISDGAPVDDSTNALNIPHYLDAHLHQVIDYIENKTNIELAAIGIGHDVKKYYKNSVQIKDVDDLSNTMFAQLSKIFKK